MNTSTTDRPILTGRWGGKWELISRRPYNQGYHQNMDLEMFIVKSLRTGYYCKRGMRSDSFL